MYKGFKRIITVISAVIMAAVFTAGCSGPIGTVDIRTETGRGASPADIIVKNGSEEIKGYASDLGVVDIRDDAANADDNSFITSDAAMLVCVDTAEVIFSKNVYGKVAPASLTKLLTALVALREMDFDSYVTLTNETAVDYPDAQVAGFQAGDTVLFRDLFSAMLVYSGNECANGVACAVKGHIKDFVKDMNDTAKEIDCTGTHYVNPHGLDEDGHYTCVYDLYLVFRECLKYPEFTDQITKTYTSFYYTRADGSTGSMYLTTTNLYLKGVYYAPGDIEAVGGKTGTTINGGACLICLFVDGEGKQYIGISMGNADKPQLYSQMNAMLSLVAD
ncbi:MAG: D-alanyl-D-alanine carboxypeptidase [Lachnospiraceae bacterium]|nr:D-alanyl-D-alanine carboxypeptidase [Lachnospiraceae bacterium]